MFPLISLLALLAAPPLEPPAATAPTPAPSFLNDIEPILTRYGCNSGGCHGKLAGQNGFRLSLRGYAPEWDHEWIVRESRGRRVQFTAPNQSLLLLKATGQLPHGGGQRIVPNSPAHQSLVQWITAGAPGPRTGEPALVALEISPSSSQAKPNDEIQFRVVARFDDQSERDVTSLTRFEAQDSGHLEVRPEGSLRVLRNGESVVRASFLGEVAIATVTVPYDAPPRPEVYASRTNGIDHAVMDKLAALRLEPSPTCDDATFLRRAMLDAIGTLPTSDEVRQFLADPRPNKRQHLVEALVERPEFNDFWALQLGDLLQNRRERDHDVRGVKGVRAFHAWLHSQLAARRPWNELVRELLTIEGAANDKPAVGYYIVTVGEKEAVESEIADSVAQSLLGARIGCARCHNHPLERITQDDYYHFSAFFSRIALQRTPIEQGPTSLHHGTRHTLQLAKQRDEAKAKLALLAANAPGTPAPDPKALEALQKQIVDFEKQMEQSLQAPPTANQPRTHKPLAPQPLDRSKIVLAPGQDPRVPLADWVTSRQNAAFANAFVNRVWKHFFSVGIVEPVDDLRATNPPSNAALMQVLSHEFVEHGYDLRHLVRFILLSRTYQLAADTLPGNVHDARFYSHYYPRRLPAETLLDAIAQATDIPENFPGYPVGTRAIQVPDVGVDSYFLTLFGRSARVTACACERDAAVTLPQLLHLQNGDILANRLAQADSRIQRLAGQPTSPRQAVEELFLATLSRLPSDAELQAAVATLPASAKDALPPNASERSEWLVDLAWALLNSKEFTFNR